MSACTFHAIHECLEDGKLNTKVVVLRGNVLVSAGTRQLHISNVVVFNLKSEINQSISSMIVNETESNRHSSEETASESGTRFHR